jgi:hypothetical protein
VSGGAGSFPFGAAGGAGGQPFGTQPLSSGGGGGGGSSLDAVIQSRITQLTGMQGFSFWSDPFLYYPVPGVDNNLNPSPFQNLHAADLYYPNNAPGGVIQVVNNVGFGGMLISPDRSGLPTPAWTFVGALNVANPVGLYMFARFRVVTTGVNPIYGGWSNADDSFAIGMIDPTNLGVFAVGSGQGQGAFGAVAGNVTGATLTKFVNASPAISPAASLDVWHDLELYTRDGKWWVRFDQGDTEVDCSAMFTAPPGGIVPHLGMPFCWVMSRTLLSGLPAVDIDHVAYAAQANR